MGSAGIGKYGHGRTHDPRCNCPDCNWSYAQHNAMSHCTCVHCTEHRELFMDAPRVTRPEEMYRGPVQSTIPSNPVTVARKVETVGNLNICIRKGCSAIIKGDAAARVEVETSIGPDGERTLYILCPACVEDVDTLLHLPPTSDRDRAYETPYAGYEAASGDDVAAATTEQLAAELLTRLMKDAGKTKALGSSEG